MDIGIKYYDPNIPRLDEMKFGDGEWMSLFCRNVCITNYISDRKNDCLVYPNGFYFRKNDELRVHVGISVSFPDYCEANIIPVNNIFKKSGLIMQNSFEVIDTKCLRYQSEWVLHFICLREYDYLKQYTKVAQFRIRKMNAYHIQEIGEE